MARVDLAAAAFFTGGFVVTFGCAGVVGLIVACVAGTVFFATDLAVRVGMVSTALARRAGFSAAFTVAFLTLAIACVARRSGAIDLTGLAGLVGLTTGAFVDVVLVVFVAACATACAALLAVDLVGVIPLATLAALAPLPGEVALANFPVFAVAGFALRATFSACLLGASMGFADILARVVAAGVAAGAVSHKVACFATTDVTFPAAFTFVAVFAAPERFTTGFAG